MNTIVQGSPRASRVKTMIGAALATLAIAAGVTAATAEPAAAMKADPNTPYCRGLLLTMAYAYEHSVTLGDWIYENLYSPACEDAVQGGELEIEEPGPPIWG